MTNPNKASCLSIQTLDQIGQNEISPNELLTIEEHVSECQGCREMFDSFYSSPQWTEQIRPALTENQRPISSASNSEADHQTSVLRLLGPTDDPNMLGRIGNYEIVGIIGQGGMGVVFKAMDRSLNRFVAIKMLLPHLAASGAARKRFAREGQAVAAVVDDHVMAIHSVDEWQGIPYLVMTYSRGVSLQKRLNDSGPFELREILRVGMQAAKGLAAAHAQGIVHRDIKPSNILLDQHVERVQLVDFGLARAVDDASLTCSGTLAGTPQYMSPEQARAEAVDHRSDLFSLGSVLYAMCAGYAPFRADSSYSVLRLIIEKEPRPIREINSDIPDWMCSIIERLMSKSQLGRYASANEVASILEQCLAHVQDPMQHALPLSVQEFGKRSKLKWTIVSRLQRWFPIMNDKRIVSLISLILLLIALLVPWPVASMGMLEPALAFAVPSAVLSLGFALLSRSEYFSKVVLWCFGFAIGLAVIGIGVSVPIWMTRAYRMAHDVEAEAAYAKMQQLNAEFEARKSKTKVDQMTQQPPASRSPLWLEYTPARLEAARKNKKVVIIEFTADWCLNGKTLQAMELDRKEVLEAIDTKEVVAIEVDLTEKDAAGWDLLREYGKNSIPLLVIEEPGTLDPWQRDSYTTSDVIEVLSAARKTFNSKNDTGAEKRQVPIIQDGDAGSIHWRQPDENGFQAGVRLSPSLRSYRFGQKISIQFLYRSILNNSLPKIIPQFPEYILEVYDANGSKVEVLDNQNPNTVGGVSESIGLTIKHHPRPMLLVPITASTEERAKAISQFDDSFLVFVSPGQSYRLHLKVRTSTAFMETGVVEFEVDANDSQNVKVLRDEELGITTIIGPREMAERTAAVIDQIQKAQPTGEFNSQPKRPGETSKDILPLPPANTKQPKRPDETSTEVFPLPPATIKQPPLLWDLPMGGKGFDGAPVIADQVIYLGDLDGRVVAVSLNDGKLKWEKKFETSFAAQASVDGDTLYIGDQDGKLHALRITDGTEKWAYETEGQVIAGTGLYGEQVLFTSEDGNLYCLKQADGNLIWKYETGDQLRCGVTLSDNRTFLGGCDGKLHIVDLLTGKSALQPVPLSGPTGSTPSVSNGIVVVPTQGGDIFAISATDGQQVWKFRDPELANEFKNSVAIANGLVIASSHNRRVFALRLEDGEKVWETTLRRRCDSTPIVFDGKIALPATDGRILLLDLDTGRELWNCEVNGGFAASPAFVDNRLIVASDRGKIYCFDTNAIGKSVDSDTGQPKRNAERIINGWPVPNTIEENKLP